VRLSVQVFDGRAVEPVSAAQEWHARDHMADDDGISLYGVIGGSAGLHGDTDAELQKLRDHVAYYGPKVVSVAVYRDRDHVDMYDDRRVTEVLRTVCGGGQINFSIAWEHA